MKVATMIDPALTTDVFADRPWIFSPLVCSMNTINVKKTEKPILGALKSKKIVVKVDKQQQISSDEKWQVTINGPDSDCKDPIRMVSAPLKSLNQEDCHSMLDPWTWVGGQVELEEENSLLQGKNLEYSCTSWNERRRHFQSSSARKHAILSPSNIYNMEVWWFY